MSELPWGCLKMINNSPVDLALKPGEFVAQTLFVEFMVLAERKLEIVAQEPIEKPLTKNLQRGEDFQFDQVLHALGNVAEHCLPSLLRVLFAWYDQQNRQLYTVLQQRTAAMHSVKIDPGKQVTKPGDVRDYVLEKKGLAVDFIFCLVLVEILKQLPLHPGHDDLINHVIQLAFKQFRYKDVTTFGQNAANAHIIADLFAEVVGIIAQPRFLMVRKKFMQELVDWRAKELTPIVAQNVVSLLMGMKFFRIKMVPIEDFEMCMGFLHELGSYFLEVKDREIKHALAGLFVEILLPVAATVKTEVNVPVLKTFVELLYPHTLDLATKKKHLLACFPLLTCLLCISQKQFFLTNWHYFLTMCLSNLKHKDTKVSRVALESLYRLLWVYMIRIKCESNTATQSRLQSIVNSLFPKGSRYVIPRDTPLNIFVKIIHFIAQERLDFAFKEVIFDLLSVGRPVRTIYPERMNIGLRALLVIADGLQQRDGAPPMPRTVGVMPSGNTLRIKKTFLTKPLTNEVARHIGIDVYYAPCRRAFDGILRTLDLQVGRPLLMTVAQTTGKDTDELIGGERKAKLDLYRTCVAAVPRLLPDGMSHQDVIDLLARLTVHVDEELRGLACQTLQNLMLECPDWREDVLHGFLQFIAKEIQDSYPQLLDTAIRMLLQLVCNWRNAANSMARRDSQAQTQQRQPQASGSGPPAVQVAPILRSESNALVLHCVEGLALLMLCQGRSTPRKLAVAILREVKNLLPLLCAEEGYERPVIDVLDSACSYVLEWYLPHVSKAEKASWFANYNVDFSWLSEKIATVETDFSLVAADLGTEYMQWDSWASVMSGFLEPRFLMSQCPTAVAYAWPAAHMRITTVFGYVDPNNPQNDTRASLLRSSKSKATAGLYGGETLTHNHYLSLWQKYLVFACAVAPPALGSVATVVRCGSPDRLQNSAEFGEMSRSSELRIPRLANVSATNLFKLVVPLLRCEMTDMRDTVVLGLGSVNAASLDCLLDELGAYLREAGERKQENLRRKRRRDLLRLQLIRLFQAAVYRGTLGFGVVNDHATGQLKRLYIDFMENARLYLETEHDRDMQILHAMRLHFAKFVGSLIRLVPVEKRQNFLPAESRYNLFYLFASWSGRLGLSLDRRHSRDRDQLSSLEYFSVSAMCAVLCCGPVFDPHSISDDGYIYGWLECLLLSENDMIIPLAEETLVLLLEYNADTSSLLDWVIERCYTAPAKVADKCFKALAAMFSSREYPCDQVAMFNVTLMFSGYPEVEMQQLAVELLQLLEQRFFNEETLQYSSSDDGQPSSNRNSMPDVLESSFLKSQLLLSQQLAELHPEMTMPMFSEITWRFQNAKPARRASLLHYLLPWLYNIELVDPSLECADNTATLSLSAKISESQALARRILKGEGWGSAPASEMVLNNLLYLTIKYGNEHATQLEKLWAGLVSYWPQNLRVILRYLMVMATLSPSTALPYAKRIVVYLARVMPERLVHELMNELQTLDMFRCPLERTELAPFYRWVRRDRVDGEDNEVGVGGGRERLDHPGTIHTKRRTPCDELVAVGMDEPPELPSCPNVEPSASMTSLITLKADVVNAKFAAQAALLEEDEDQTKTLVRPQKEHRPPFQLPMPAYGGYYCPLGDVLLNSSLQLPNMHRSNMAMLLLCDLLVADVDIEWTVHLPAMLHVAVLGMDHSRELVFEHCKQLLINLVVAYSGDAVPAREVAKVLIAHSLGSQLSLTAKADDSSSTTTSGTRSTITSFSSVVSRGFTDSTLVLTAPPPATSDALVQKDAYTLRFDSTAELAIAITEFLASHRGSALWAFEDITARNWRIPSGEQLTCFVSHVSRFLCDLLPSARIASRWAQTALHAALSCSNRHFAGRSFQIFRALHVPLSSRMLSDILSRLVETVSEQGDDMQGYVTEIMLTLDAAVFHIELSEHMQPEQIRELITSSTAANSALVLAQGVSERVQSPTHCRSTSYSAVIRRHGGIADRKDPRCHSQGEASVLASFLGPAAITRSKSAQALKSLSEDDQDDHMVSLSQLLWIAVCMLDSDYEHEYLLSLRLLDKLLDLSTQERNECLERLNRMVQQLKWTTFPGVLSLVLKGCTFCVSYDTALHVLSKCIHLLDSQMIDKLQGYGFMLTVVALLPYLILHYEEPTKLCVQAAENIAERCAAELERINARKNANDTIGSTGSGSSTNTMSEHPLEHLATVMRHYSRYTFTKDNFQWTKCVVKYLCDTFANVSVKILPFLTEMLEKGPTIIHQPALQLMYCLFHHIDFTSTPAPTINGDFLKAVSKHIQGPCWKDASKILKLAVTRSSFISTVSMVQSHDAFAASDLGPGGAMASDLSGRKELPGRTMEFSVDFSALHSAVLEPNQAQGTADVCSPKRQTDSLKKPWLSQMRVRERLVGLLNASGLRVGLPKSPSVIFSQSSQDLPNERHSSQYSSSGELTAAEPGQPSGTPSPDANLADADATFPPVFKEFDFLDGEPDSMSESVDSCFNWLSTMTMRPRSHSYAEEPMSSSLAYTGSVPDLEHRTQSDSESSDEEEESTSSHNSQAEEEQADINAQDIDRLFVDGRAPSIQDTRAATPASMTLSFGSQADLLATPGPPPVTLECCHHSIGHIEEVWAVHVTQVTLDRDGTVVANSTLLFSQLYKEACNKLCSLMRDALHFLQTSEPLREAAAAFLKALDVLMRVSECPFAFVTPQFLIACNLLQKQKFQVLELREHFETFLERREHTIKALNAVKSGKRLRLLGQQLQELSALEQEVELCRCLYKLFFQLMLLYEAYGKLITNIQSQVNSEQVTNLSVDAARLHNALLCAVGELASAADSASQVVPAHNVQHTLTQRLQSGEAKQAIVLLRACRTSQAFSRQEFGCCEEEDVEVLLLLYCRTMAENYSNCAVLVHCDQTLTDKCTALMETNLALSAAVRSLNDVLRENRNRALEHIVDV